MTQRANQAADGFRREFRVLIQGNHKGIAPVKLGRRHAGVIIEVVTVTVDDEPVQTFQVAALALPADPCAFALVIGAPALQVQVAVLRITLLKGFQGGRSSAQDQVIRHLLGGETVREISQEHIFDVGVGVSVAQLGQAADHVHGLFRGGKKRGKDDQGPLTFL